MEGLGNGKKRKTRELTVNNRLFVLLENRLLILVFNHTQRPQVLMVSTQDNQNKRT